jgi:hypothetical protein
MGRNLFGNYLKINKKNWEFIYIYDIGRLGGTLIGRINVHLPFLILLMDII